MEKSRGRKEGNAQAKARKNWRRRNKEDPHYLAALNKWRDFKVKMPAEFHFPCYYDAWKMGLWNPDKTKTFQTPLTHGAESTHNVRFDRDDVEKEIRTLANHADRLLKGRLGQALARLLEDFKRKKVERIRAINRRREKKNATLPPEKRKKLRIEPKFEHCAQCAADFILHGPAGLPYASFLVDARKDLVYAKAVPMTGWAPRQRFRASTIAFSKIACLSRATMFARPTFAGMEDRPCRSRHTFASRSDFLDEVEEHFSC